MGRAVVIVTHDERVLEYGDLMVEVADGVAGPVRDIAKEGVKHAS
jgi:ABC-type lipoprotein export system ATPase subunit